MGVSTGCSITGFGFGTSVVLKLGCITLYLCASAPERVITRVPINLLSSRIICVALRVTSSPGFTPMGLAFTITPLPLLSLYHAKSTVRVVAGTTIKSGSVLEFRTV